MPTVRGSRTPQTFPERQRLPAKDAERTYYILLVRKLCLENQYERVGLGKIKLSCVSKEYCEGELS